VPNVNELYIAQIRRDLQAWAGFNYQNWQNAAQFSVANNIDLEEALVWANKAIEGVPERGRRTRRFSTYSTEASVLRARSGSGRGSTMDRAMRSEGAGAQQIHPVRDERVQAEEKRKRPWRSSNSIASSIPTTGSSPIWTRARIYRPGRQEERHRQLGSRAQKTFRPVSRESAGL
jgi:hypothetical protein